MRSLPHLLTAALCGVVASALAVAPTSAASSQVTAAQLRSDILAFEHQLVTTGHVDLSHVPGLISQIQASSTDWPTATPITGSNCMPKQTTAPTVNACTYGDPHSRTTVVLFGDSHLEQYLDVFAPMARARHWHLITYFRGNCGAAQATASPSHQSSEPLCQQWRVKAFATIARVKPAMIVIGQSDDALPGKPKAAAADEQATLSTLLPIVHNKASHIVTMVDQTEDDYPDGVSDEATCLARAGLRVTYDATNTPTGLKNPNVCYRIFSAPYHAAAIKIRTAVAAVDTTAGIIRVDPNPWLCDTTGAYQICPPVILGTLVYHDPWHLSTTFVGRLATLLNAAIPKV